MVSVEYVRGYYAHSKCTCQTPTAHIDGILPTIERFVILMYDKEIPDDSVNKARQTLFTQKVGK